MDADRTHTARGDRGFTLVEVLIVLLTMGVIATTMAAAVTVVLKTSPSTEVRTDDARSLQGLVTWLPEDVDATPPDGFSTSSTAWPCAGTPPAGNTVLALNWTEVTDKTYRHAAAYRYELAGTEWHMSRYECTDGGSGVMGNPQRVNLTSALPPWDTMAPPAFVKMCAANVDADGKCPPGSEILTTTSPDVESIKLTVTRLDGVQTTIDAAPKNPDQDLSDDPEATTNKFPVISQTNWTVDMYAGTTATFDLTVDGPFNPYDPDGDPISVAIDTSEPMPPGVTAVTSDPMGLEITTAAGLPNGMISPKLFLVISDNRAGWVQPTVTVRIVPKPNNAPVAGVDPYALTLGPSEVIVLPIDVTHAVTDVDGDALSLVSVNKWPVELLTPPTIGGALGPMELQIVGPPVVAIPGPASDTIEVELTDGKANIKVDIVVTLVNPAPPNGSPTATSGNLDVTIDAGDSFTLDLATSHGVADPDGNPLWTSVVSAPAGLTVDATKGLIVDVDSDAGLAPGTLAPVVLRVRDPKGLTVDVTVTITIASVTPPASDCVLGSLTASPDPISRQGKGVGARHLKDNVTVTVTYTGTCDGLVLTYDTGDTSGLGVGVGRVFPAGSPASITIYSSGNGGTEKWIAGNHVLTASTTSTVFPNAVSTTLTVN